MLNRRHIRIKILQLLYSKTTGKIDNRSLLKQFEQTSQNFYKLFLTQLILLKEIFKESIRVIDLNEKKYFKKDSMFVLLTSRFNICMFQDILMMLSHEQALLKSFLAKSTSIMCSLFSLSSLKSLRAFFESNRSSPVLLNVPAIG